ncbi:MAG: glycosyltransferase family 2 protein [Acidobacteriota bacterium]|nr:glycosyltransferase family 2 protein [Acidobacteriota bacterium]
MDISVIIPTFNRREIVRRTVETLIAQTLPADRYELIVVIDGSTDGTAAMLRALRPACRLRVIEQENRGLAGARNSGFRAAETGLVLFLDDDMLCAPGLIAAHVAAHGTVDRMVGFGAIFLSPDSPPSLAVECFHREIGAFYLQQMQSASTSWQEIECVFSNTSLPRSVLIEADGFDEAFRMREDLELGVRLCNAGVKARYIDSAVAYQYYEKSAADLIRDAQAFAAADVMFARRYPDAPMQGQWSRYAAEPAWKRSVYTIAALSPAVMDYVLAPVCGLGERFFAVSRLRNAGVRALQMRRRIHWLHEVMQLGMPSSGPAKGKVR